MNGNGRTPFFSIVMPTYNRGALVEAALQSVLRQRFESFEVIVVDDGSTDDTADRVAMFPTVKLLRQTNSGPGAARNLGLRNARGRYVAFLDSDDLFFPWSLDVYARVIGARGEPAFVAGCPHVFRNDAELEGVAESEPDCDAFLDYLAASDAWRWYGVSSFVVRTDVLRQCGGFVESRMNAEDADLSLKIGAADGFVHVRRPATFGYRSHEGNITGDVGLNGTGISHIVAEEAAGRYPGGRGRRRDRRRIITRHTRPFTLACLRSGRWRDGVGLYGRTALWNLRDGRLRYVVGFPFVAAAGILRESCRK